MPVRLLLVDDDHAMLAQLTALLSEEFEIVGTAGGGEAMITAVDSLNPDVVLADIAMPGMDGIEASRRVLRERGPMPIVLLTMHKEPELVQRALSMGVRGYVHKLTAGDEVIPAIYSVLRGEVFVSPSCM
jgi:DNA-binding NarL/FixJ family response regulator